VSYNNYLAYTNTIQDVLSRLDNRNLPSQSRNNRPFPKQPLPLVFQPHLPKPPLAQHGCPNQHNHPHKHNLSSPKTSLAQASVSRVPPVNKQPRGEQPAYGPFNRVSRVASITFQPHTDGPDSDFQQGYHLRRLHDATLPTRLAHLVQ
jgi:hypothetical protein